MAFVDLRFNQTVRNILANGKWQEDAHVRTHWADGTPAKAISCQNVMLVFDSAKDTLALTNKLFFERYAAHEGFWIWQDMSNKVSDLRARIKRENTVWDNWEEKDPESEWYGTIGPAYGYQLAQRDQPFKISMLNVSLLPVWMQYEVEQLLLADPANSEKDIMLNQVDFVIQMLAHPELRGSRRIQTSLWNMKDMRKMKLPPCVWSTHWTYSDGKLHLSVKIRSNDIGCGNAFNMFQYQVLHHVVAQVTNIPVGTIAFIIDDAHIYDRHIPLLQEQLKELTHEDAKLWINPDVKNFYDFDVDRDMKLLNKQPARRFDFELTAN